MAFGDLNKNGEGLARLKENEWVKLFVDGGNYILAKIKGAGQEGLDIEQYTRSSNTPKFEPYDAFIAYRTITGFVRIPESEAKEFLEKEPGLKRYLDGYVRINTSTSTLVGRLSETRTDGLMLSPYMRNKLEDDLFELCDRGSLLVVGTDIKTIIPSSLEEVKNYIDKCNKKIEEAKKREDVKEKKEEKK